MISADENPIVILTQLREKFQGARHIRPFIDVVTEKYEFVGGARVYFVKKRFERIRIPVDVSDREKAHWLE